MLVVWRARRAGTSEQIVGWAADMVQELWELAARMRQWPEKTATELIRQQGRASPPPREILRQVVLPHAAEELDDHLVTCPRRSPQTEPIDLERRVPCRKNNQGRSSAVMTKQDS